MATEPHKYVSQIDIGEKYTDIATGRIGTATSITFSHGSDSQSVKIEWMAGNEQHEMWCESGRLAVFVPERDGTAL